MSIPAGQKTIEILLIVQYALLRESLERLLSTGLGFKVAAQCAAVPEALDLVKRERTDVVLLDLDFGRNPCKQFIHIARQRGFKGKILLLGDEINENDVADFIRSGISGIFQKSDPAALLGHGIRDVVAGNVWFKQEHLQTALNCDAEPASGGRKREFTRREESVLSLVCEGLTNREIGAEIGVSEGSVKATVQQLFAKFGVRSRSRLVRMALEHRNRDSGYKLP